MATVRMVVLLEGSRGPDSGPSGVQILDTLGPGIRPAPSGLRTRGSRIWTGLR